MFEKGAFSSVEELKGRILAAKGDKPADLVIKNTRFLNVFNGTFETGDVAVSEGVIVGVKESYQGTNEIDGKDVFVVPGFIDAHVHIESSLMTPGSFEKAVLPCGTTSIVWDPHEIANVLGVNGIKWAIEASEGLLLDVFLMLPSCVPSTPTEMGLETSGAAIGPQDLASFLSHKRVLGLAEMMNFPGVLFLNDEVLEKLSLFRDKKRDGHSPGLTGKMLNAYSSAGIHSCHESTVLAEAEEKLMKGIHALIREGSCAKDAKALLPMLTSYSASNVAFCSDDRNPADIAKEGHINHIIDIALWAGHKPQDVFIAASYGPSRIYGLIDRGAIAPGMVADFCLVTPKKAQDWKTGLSIKTVFKKGREISKEVFKEEQRKDTYKRREKNLDLCSVTQDLFVVEPVLTRAVTAEKAKVNVIGVRPGQIITDALVEELPISHGEIHPSVEKNIQKIAVLERHHATGLYAAGFVKGFGLKNAAIATSINHDAHNVIVVGTDNEVMEAAVKRLQEIDGGIVVIEKGGQRREELRLPLGGLMTDAEPDEVAGAIIKLKKLARELGCTLEEPFLQLSFLALPVIPALKLSDRGLIDACQFKIIPVVVQN